MSEIRKEIIENGIHYRLFGDYCLPDFRNPDGLPSFGKWSDLHHEYLREHQTSAYCRLVFEDRLAEYLRTFEEQAKERHLRIVEELKKAEGITEELKARDAMEWVRRMNAIAAAADELVMDEMVYC